jgi:hypothetical protein
MPGIARLAAMIKRLRPLPIGPKRGTTLIGKVAGLSGLAPTRETLDRLYAILSILDTKATGLLTVNAFLIAVLVVFLNELDKISRVIGIEIPARILEWQMVLLGFSAFLCLLVVRVTWKFMGYVPKRPTDEAAFDDELRRLANVVYDRTLFYWLAWFFALIGFVLTLAWWHWWLLLIGFPVVAIIIWGRG